MADPQDYLVPEGDENNDDTFGSSMIDVDADWTPDDSEMGDLNSFMDSQRTAGQSGGSGGYGGARGAYVLGGGARGAVGGGGRGGGGKPSKAFFDDDDIDTLLALKPTDLLRSAMTDEVDGDEVDMTSLMRSVAIGSGQVPPGLGGPPGLGYGGGAGGYGVGGGMPPGLNVGRPNQAPIGSPARGSGPPGLGMGGSGSVGSAQGAPALVPKPPQLTPEQLAALTPQQLMNMEQWNLLYQQQQMREVQEQHAQQLAAQRQQQQQLMAQHQQMLAQREEAAKRAAAAQVDDASTDASSDGEGDASATSSKANKRGRWGGKGTARMSPYEIDLIIRAMEHQVATQNPFLDDYYHQNVRIMLNPNHYTAHRPICDVAPPKRRQLEKDPFAGCLGRIASGSSRAPRIMVVMDQGTSSTNTPNQTNNNQQPKTAKTAPKSAHDVLASDKPFSASLGHMAQDGGVRVSDQRRLMLTIEDAFVILLELEDLKQLQHLHIHAARVPSLKSNAQEEQKANEKEAQKKDVMIMEHLHQIIALLAIPRMGTPDAQPNHPQYAQWEAFMLAILRIPKGARLFARLLLLLPGAVAVSILRVFMRHLTELAALSVKHEEHASLVNIADYIRRVILQADLDLLDPLISSLWDGASALFAELPTTMGAKVGFYVLNSLLSRVHDLKGKPDIARDPRLSAFLRKFLKLHATMLEVLRGQLTALLGHAVQVNAKKESGKGASAGSGATLNVNVTAVAPSNPKHTKPLTRSTKSSPHTSEAQTWEFIFYLMLCSPVADKKQIHTELAEQLSVSSITSDTHMDIVNLKTTFTGVLAQQADPGFEALVSQAQHWMMQIHSQMASQIAPTSSPQPTQNPLAMPPNMNTTSRAPPPRISTPPAVAFPHMTGPPAPGLPHPQMMMSMPMMPPGMMPPMGFGPANPGALPNHPMFSSVPHPSVAPNNILHSMGNPTSSPSKQ